MSETPDPPKQPSPPATFTLRGGLLGAILVYLISLALIVAIILPTMYRDRLGWDSLNTPESLDVVKIAIKLSLVAAVIGFFAGKEGARCQSVNAAFLRGGILCGLATLICIPVLSFTYFRTLHIYTTGFYALCAIAFAILTASGAIVSGLAAIVVRDRRESGRNRFIPQFTLQEIFIAFTIVSIIISALASAAALRL
ncbi:MAG: hypothetical protein IT426_18950 [Pirellulales bacterium]|nr:hypothetical protein [Pirellulales bacterium]